MNSPIFIGGMMKSGTSLLRAMLGEHSSIASNLETYWFDLRPPDYNQYKEHVQRLTLFFDLDEDTVQRVFQKSSSAEEFLDAFMNMFLEKSKKQRWLEKTPKNILYIESILKFWPRAKIIICQRDPRDVFASFKLAKKNYDAQSFANLWVEQNKNLLNSLELPCSNDNNIKIISYESLILNTEIVMKDVFDFLEEAYEQDVINYQGKKDDFEKVLSVTGKKSSTLERIQQPITKKRIGIYKEHLTENECITMADIAKKNGLERHWKDNIFAAEKESV